jgi:hypothetical protein
VPERLRNAESVTIDAEVALVAPNVTDAYAAVDQLVGSLEHTPGVVDVRVADVPAAPGAKPASGAQLVRVGVSWDPTLAPAPADKPASADVPNAHAFIRRLSAADGVEIGDVSGEVTESRIPGTDWVEERWKIQTRDPARVLATLRIHNYAAALERGHGHGVVTRCAMLAPKDRSEKAGYLRMELEFTVLRHARPDELASAHQP